MITFDQLTKRHENEVLRKKRLAFVGISLDNVLKDEGQDLSKDSRASSQESDNGIIFCVICIHSRLIYILE